MTIPTKPEKLTVPATPQRGEDPTTFSNKVNAFVLFYSELVDYTDLSLDWQNTVYTATALEYNNAVTAKNEAQSARDESVAARTDSMQYASQASNSASAAGSAAQAVADGQTQINLLLGAGIGTSYLDDGELIMNYTEAVVSDLEINASGELVITGV